MQLPDLSGIVNNTTQPMRTLKLTLMLLTAASLAITPFAHAKEPAITKGRGFKKNMPIRVIRKIVLPTAYHEDLFYDGEYIWVANGQGGDTWIVDPESGSIVSRIEPVGSFTEGITEAGDKKLWVTDWEDKKLYRVTIDKTFMVKDHEVSFDPSYLTGIVRAGEDVYMITWERGLGTKYYLLRIDSGGNVLEKTRIKVMHEPAHMAWDGKHIWITSWYDSRVYKLDPETFTFLGYFKAPIPKATGITWDGKYLWVTGTYQQLYQVEVIE